MPSPRRTPPLEPVAARAHRRACAAAAELLAEEQAGIVSRRQLYALGVTRWQVKARIRAQRWQRTGRQTVSVTTGELTEQARHWVAVLETGPRAALAGLTALHAAGLKSITEAAVHVIAPKSSTPLKPPGVRVHESRRFNEQDVLTNGVRRQRPAVAAVHAALWAVSDRQAALFLVAPVQQRLVKVADVAAALDVVRRHPRRTLLRTLLHDIAAGAQSLHELDLTAGLRRRGLPQPARQVVVELPGGRAYLDAEWEEYGVALELDGSQHEEAAAKVDDAFRDLEVATSERTTVRVPLLALRLDEEGFYRRLAALLRSRGWTAARADAA